LIQFYLYAVLRKVSKSMVLVVETEDKESQLKAFNKGIEKHRLLLLDIESYDGLNIIDV
jgi:hypothetical protein